MLTALWTSGCGDGGAGGEGPSDSRSGAPAEEFDADPGEPGLRPEEVARAYVEALDERDGERFCGLVAPYISGGYDLAASDLDSPLGALTDCPGLVSAFIGYVEDCCPPEFKAAEVKRLREGQRHGELRSFDLVIRMHVVQDGTPRVESLADRVWLARLDGAWRVAKLSAVARAASLTMPRFGRAEQAADDEDDALAPPDVAEEQRLFAEAVERFDRLAHRRRASYKKPAPATACSGGMVLKDDEGDLDWNGIGPGGDPPPVDGGDITKVSVVVRGKEVCVRWDLAGAPTRPMGLTYGHRRGPTNGQFFDVELHPNGTTRVTSGEDDAGRPIVVPGEVGVGDSSVTLMLDPESFRAGQREWLRPEPPPLVVFGVSASAVAPARGGRSVLDKLGRGSSATFRYPDGGLCELEGC
jgi:hypothetical protein